VDGPAPRVHPPDELRQVEPPLAVGPLERPEVKEGAPLVDGQIGEGLEPLHDRLGVPVRQLREEVVLGGGVGRVVVGVALELLETQVVEAAREGGGEERTRCGSKGAGAECVRRHETICPTYEIDAVEGCGGQKRRGGETDGPSASAGQSSQGNIDEGSLLLMTLLLAAQSLQVGLPQLGKVATAELSRVKLSPHDRPTETPVVNLPLPSWGSN